MLKVLLKVFAAYSKTLEEKDKLKKKLLSEKEPVIDDLRGSQLILFAEDAKIKKFTVKKACSKEKAKSVARQPFVSLIF